jgi:hypothetical protein
MTGMKDFYTREAANEGISVPLYLPDGKKTKHFLMIHGVDSDAFREANAEISRNALRIAAIENDKEKKSALKDEKHKLLASLIFAWSFDEECTPENVKNFLINAPQVADMVDQMATRRSLFLKKRSTNSRSTRMQSSSSTKPRKDRK